MNFNTAINLWFLPEKSSLMRCCTSPHRRTNLYHRTFYKTCCVEFHRLNVCSKNTFVLTQLNRHINHWECPASPLWMLSLQIKEDLHRLSFAYITQLVPLVMANSYSNKWCNFALIKCWTEDAFPQKAGRATICTCKVACCHKCPNIFLLCTYCIVLF